MAPGICVSRWADAIIVVTGTAGMVGSRKRPQFRFLTIVESDLEDILLDDVNGGGSVYMLRESVGRRYYLVEFRSRRSSYYERNLPAEGLLIWRINPLVSGNENERTPLVELVCADGQYADAGFPLGQVGDPFRGRDNLDFGLLMRPIAKRSAGTWGMPATCGMGFKYTDFWAASNPAAAPGIAVTNIRPVGDQMVASMRVADDRRAGLVTLNQTWSDRVEIVGDLLVMPGVRLEVASGTRIEELHEMHSRWETIQSAWSLSCRDS